MKKTLALLISFALLLAIIPKNTQAASWPSASNPTTKYVTTKKLSLYVKAGTREKIYFTISQNTIVNVYTKTKTKIANGYKWSYVHCGAGFNGWLQTKYLKSLKPLAKYDTTAKIDMKNSASTKGKTVTSIPKGDRVNIYSNIKAKKANGFKWYYARYGSKEGWIQGKYVKKAVGRSKHTKYVIDYDGYYLSVLAGIDFKSDAVPELNLSYPNTFFINGEKAVYNGEKYFGITSNDGLKGFAPESLRTLCRQYQKSDDNNLALSVNKDDMIKKFGVPNTNSRNNFGGHYGIYYQNSIWNNGYYAMFYGTNEGQQYGRASELRMTNTNYNYDGVNYIGKTFAEVKKLMKSQTKRHYQYQPAIYRDVRLFDKNNKEKSALEYNINIINPYWTYDSSPFFKMFFLGEGVIDKNDPAYLTQKVTEVVYLSKPNFMQYNIGDNSGGRGLYE